MTEEEFAEKIANLVAIRDALSTTEFTQSVVDVCSRFLAARTVEYQARVKQYVSRLDGSSESAVRLLSGLRAEEIDSLGGFGKQEGR